MRNCLLAVLVAVAAGCGSPAPPLAGGKPVAHWVESLKDRDPKVRKLAVRKLGNVGASDPAALPALLGALQDRNAAVRREAVLALVKFGPDAPEAVRALTRAGERDHDPQVRAQAVRALAGLRAAAPARDARGQSSSGIGR